MKTKILPKDNTINPAHIKKGGEFNVTSKLRAKDWLKWEHNGETRVNLVQYLINFYPTELWNMIHQKNSKVSLVRPAYAQLKTKIAKTNPSLIEELKQKHETRNAVRKLKKELSKGKVISKSNGFKKISSIRIDN